MNAPFPAGVFGAAVALAAAALAGVALERLAGGWLDAYERDAAAPGPGAAFEPRAAWRAAAALGVAVVAAWWWEVVCLGLEPAGIDGAPVAASWGPFTRWLGHAALLSLLAAATWIDLRHHVIPDWITTSGTLVALVAVWGFPAILLPVALEVPRPFAPPRLVADLLAATGPLSSVDPGSAASPLALAAALAIFAAWWWLVTSPGDLLPGVAADDPLPDPTAAEAPSAPAARDRRMLVLLAVGLAAIAAAWWWGGPRFVALLASLAGAAVGGGLVWATRAGASLAMGREAMGLGDVTLMAMVGAWIGWQACVLACFFGVLIGLVHGVSRMALRLGSELPFGPGLCAGVVLVVAAWRTVWGAAGENFAAPLEFAAVAVAVVVGTAVALAVWMALPDRARRPVLAVVLVLLAALVVWVWVIGAPGAG
ncbi:MAG: prepilin peptidase [Planctomycetaceae bacterium]